MFMKMVMVFVLLYKYQDWADLLLILKRLFEITCFQVQGHVGFHHYSSTTSWKYHCHHYLWPYFQPLSQLLYYYHICCGFKTHSYLNTTMSS
jgi:hypothetical protein